MRSRTHVDRGSRPAPWVLVTAWFLALTYGVGAPICAVVEFTRGTFSARFDLPPALIIVTCASQLVCAIGILLPRVAPWSAAVLSLTSLGALGAHLRIGSPITALPALAFTILQTGFLLKTWSRDP